MKPKKPPPAPRLKIADYSSDPAMLGEALALLAAAAYGVAGVSIVHAKPQARGDNGVFLSIVVTAVCAWVLWLITSTAAWILLLSGSGGTAVLIFACAGLCANVLGRRSMYRVTEVAGAVNAGLLRRLVPVFALPCAFVVLGQTPGPQLLVGGAFVLAGVLSYFRPSKTPLGGWVALGTLSAFAYAMAYTLRGLGLLYLPDAALGIAIGASVAAVWVAFATMLRQGRSRGWRHITTDRTPAHWITAIALSAGQALQFFALSHTSVAAVSVLGALDVLFAALLIHWRPTQEKVALSRLMLAMFLAMVGTVLLLSP
ncbi:EamA family transporter [uncultured Shimia sp.]|uniref:EamA family transporter n=1 Tax=uncultured Shimia sp. TaxID=573152 RepID=UPI002612FC8B|nr:EamA family transporter [uncultured Shimia sp.]